MFTENQQSASTRQSGFGLLEIVLGVSILALVLIGAMSVAQNSLRLNRQAIRESQAGFLTAEGAEALRAFRDDSWTNISGLAAGTTYHLTWNGTRWATTTTGLYIDGIFWRTAVVSNVNRDANDDIVTSGGTLDSGTRKIRVETAWRASGTGTSTKAIELYLADI